MAFQYSKYITYIADKIDYYGGYVNYHQNVDGAIDSLTGLSTYNTIITPVKILVAPYSQILIDGTNIKKGDKQVFMKSTLGRPKLNDNIDINDKLYKVLEVKDIAPGVVDTLVYILQIRSYEAAKPIDVFMVEIGTLATGSIIRDSMAIWEDEGWRIIAHDHHLTNTTTLLREKPEIYRSFDGTWEGGGYYADTPWKSSAMRKYLDEDYQADQLSTELKEIMLTIELETQEDKWNDKVSLLSREELFDVEEGSSSGKYIPYFKSDSYRIARWLYDNTAIEWWTRDVVSWTPPDGVIRTVYTDGGIATHAGNQRSCVRPIIFLPKETLVVLNPDGKYVLNY